MRFLKLSILKGNIYLNPNYIESITDNTGKDPRIGASIFVGQEEARYDVLETKEEIIYLLEEF